MKEVLGSLPEVITAYKNYNLLVPTATDVQLNPFYKFHVEEVPVDLGENSGDIFKVGSVKTGKQDEKGKDIWEDVFSLSKPLLNKMAMAAGIQFNPKETYGERIDRVTYRAQAQGAMRKADGTARTETDIGQFKGPVVDGVNLRSQDTVKCLEYMVQVAIEEKPDIVCVSGDIFHQEQVGPVRYSDEMITATNIITSLAHFSKHVIVMRGTPNHDGAAQFRVLERMLLNIRNVDVVTEPGVIKTPWADIACLPGFDKQEFRAKFPGLSADEENLAWTKYISDMVFALRAECEKTPILMAHYTNIQNYLYKLIEMEEETGNHCKAEEIAEITEHMVSLFGLWDYGKVVPYLLIAVYRKDVEKCIQLIKEVLMESQKPWKMVESPLYYRYVDTVQGKSFSGVGNNFVRALATEIENKEEYEFLKGNKELEAIFSQYLK